MEVIMEKLAERISQITKQAGGEWGIQLEDLTTNEVFSLQETKMFYAASVIKVPIMIAVFAGAEEKKFNLSDTITLRKEDITGGSGVLQKMTLGTALTIYDIIMLMIIQSDNTATNILIDLVGKEYIQQQMKKVGLENSTYHHKLMIQPLEKDGSNEINALEMAEMMKKLATGKIISVWASQQMIDILKSQQLQNNIPGKLPDPSSEILGGAKRWEAAHKTGSVSKVRHDVGILYVGEQKMIFSVLSSGVDDYEAGQTLQDIGLEIYNYLLAE